MSLSQLAIGEAWSCHYHLLECVCVTRRGQGERERTMDDVVMKDGASLPFRPSCLSTCVTFSIFSVSKHFRRLSSPHCLTLP